MAEAAAGLAPWVVGGGLVGSLGGAGDAGPGGAGHYCEELRLQQLHVPLTC